MLVSASASALGGISRHPEAGRRSPEMQLGHGHEVPGW
jgi:hypothetical protein